MGCVANVTATTFPRQGVYAGRRCEVMFFYSGPILNGTIVRDDAEAPGEMIIKLDDGRFILSAECQWSPIP